MFLIGKTYTKKDIYEILKVPAERQRGAWDKGYHTYDGNVFIFSNVGIPGRTGHNYNNYWDGDEFVWEATNQSHIEQPQIKLMINPKFGQKTFLFTRTEDRSPFTFEGEVKAKEYFNITPVKIIWMFEQYPYESFEEEINEVKEDESLYEGKVSKAYVNKYERNPLARRMCIDHYGPFCNVCFFDFYLKYGELGKGFIHVHHLSPLATIRKQYQLVPETDLIPICPNCHSMIHKNKPMLTPSELRALIVANEVKE